MLNWSGYIDGVIEGPGDQLYSSLLVLLLQLGMAVVRWTDVLGKYTEDG